MKYILSLLVLLTAAVTNSDTNDGLDFGEYEKLKKFESRLLKQMESGPNFSDNYFVAFLPCGSSCQGNIFINVEERRVVGQITTCDGMEYSLESNVFVANPKLGPNHELQCKTKEYHLIDDVLVHKR